MAEYEIYKQGDIEAVRNITVFSDPQCLKYTILRTLDNDDDDIKRRVLVIRHILEMNPLILDSYRHLDSKSPLLETKVHVNLLKALIDNGANFRVARDDNWLSNVLSVAVLSKMNDSQYHSLCSYLINESKAYDLFSKREDHQSGENWKSPVVTMLSTNHSDYFESLQIIFKIPKFDINQTERLERETGEMEILTLFQIANEFDKGVDVYKLMVENGADYKARQLDNVTNLMVAVRNSDQRAVEYYVSLGFSMNDQDSVGATPILYASQDLEMIDYLRSLGADLSKTNKEGVSIVHASALSVKEHEIFSKFVIDFCKHAPELLTKKDAFGYTPLDLRKRYHPDDYNEIDMLSYLLNPLIREMSHCVT